MLSITQVPSQQAEALILFTFGHSAEVERGSVPLERSCVGRFCLGGVPVDGWCGAKRAILWAWFAGYGGEGMTVDRLCRVNETMARERLCVWRVPRRRNETLARDLNRHDRASPAKVA